MSFVKLDRGILDSTLWLHDAVVCKVFLTILTMTNREGFCEATAPVVARRANVSIEAARNAIEILESPDPDSRSLAEEGRRIIRVDGGYMLVNFARYRDKDHTAAERKRRQRERERNVTRDMRDTPPEVTPLSQTVTYREGEGEGEREEEDHDAADAASSSPGTGNGSTRRDAIPVQEIVALYHEILPELRKVAKVTPARAAHVRARWRGGDLPTLEDWRWYFGEVRKSRFLMGRGPPGQRDKPWQADFEWLVKEANCTKVAEGKYHGGRE